MARPVNEAGREAQRRAILDVASRLFAAHGFHQTGVAAICDALGMSPGALYRHFRSKAEIIEGIVALQRASVLALLDAVETSERLDLGLVELLLTCAEAASDPAALALSLEVSAEGARNARVGELVDGAYRAFTSRLADLVRAAQARGEVHPEVDPPTVAAVLAATADGLSVNPVRARLASTAALRSAPGASLREDVSTGEPLPVQRLRATLEATVRAVLGPPLDSETDQVG